MPKKNNLEIHYFIFYVHTKSMNIFFVAMAGFVSILICNIKLKIDFSYKLLENLGHIKLKLFFITIFSKDVSFYGKILRINKECAKALQIKIDLSSNSIQYFNDMFKLFSSKIYLSNVMMYSNVCINDDAKNTALVSGGFSVAFNAIQNYIICRNIGTKVEYNTCTNFCEKSKIDICARLIVCFSLYDILWSIIVALYKRRKMYGQKS